MARCRKRRCSRRTHAHSADARTAPKITKFSGAVRRERKTQLIDRCEALLAAVEQARKRANRAHAEDTEVGDPVFEFLLG